MSVILLRGTCKCPVFVVLLCVVLFWSASPRTSAQQASPEPSAEVVRDFDSLWDFTRPAESEQRFRRAFHGATTRDTDYRLELLTQIARAQGLQGQFAAAHRTLDTVHLGLGRSGAQTRVRYWLERGRVFNSSDHADQALPLFLQAWQLARAWRLIYYAADAAHMLGIAETPERALVWDHRALDIAESSKDPRAQRWIGPLCNNMGWTYYDRKEYMPALLYLRRARDYYETHGTAVQIRLARYSVGKALRSLGHIQQALTIQKAVEKRMEAAHEPNGYVYEEIAECLLALKRPDEARPYFAQAYDLLSRDMDLVRSEPKRVQRLKTQAEQQ